MLHTLEQVAKHSNVKDCWVIIKNKVYDVTEFLPAHPGGTKIILRYAGKDATKAFEPVHPPDTLERYLPDSKHLGELTAKDALELKQATLKSSGKKTRDEVRVEKAQRAKPPLSRILSVRELEDVAKQVLSFEALSYYSSASDDEISHVENIRAFTRIFFHARVLRPISHCTPSTTILGYKSRIPVFCSGAALARLGHPLGEANITRACGAAGLVQMVSSNASLSAAQIAEARVSPDQPLFFQLYKHRDDKIAAERVKEIEGLGYKAIFLTVDSAVAGSRERDIRAPWEEKKLDLLEEAKEGSAQVVVEEQEDEDEGGNFGTAGALLKFDDMDLTWEKTIPWLRSVTKLPLVLKGIQCVEDAVLAAEHGLDGIMISNHGGRQLDYSMPSIEVLYRLQKQRPDVFSKLEVYLDGGVRRGSDVVKALCLGAKAVGLGRPFLYAQSAYGEEGVMKLIQILEREMVNCMQLLGVASVQDLVPELVERVDWQPILAKL